MRTTSFPCWTRSATSRANLWMVCHGDCHDVDDYSWNWSWWSRWFSCCKHFAMSRANLRVILMRIVIRMIIIMICSGARDNAMMTSMRTLCANPLIMIIMTCVNRLTLLQTVWTIIYLGKCSSMGDSWPQRSPHGAHPSSGFKRGQVPGSSMSEYFVLLFIIFIAIIIIFSHFVSLSSASFSVSRQCSSSIPTKASSSWWLKS